MVRREGGTDARSNEDTCSQLYTASIEGKKEICQVTIIIHNSGLIPRLLFTRKQSGNETTNYWGGGAHLMVHDLRKWNQLLAELARNLLFI